MDLLLQTLCFTELTDHILTDYMFTLLKIERLLFVSNKLYKHQLMTF